MLTFTTNSVFIALAISAFGLFITVFTFMVRAIFSVAETARNHGKRMAELNLTLENINQNILGLKSNTEKNSNQIQEVQNWLQKNTNFEIRQRLF